MAEAAIARTLDLPGLTVTEAAVAISVLRVRKAAQAAAALAQAFAAPWPSEPNTVAAARPEAALPEVAWLAPGEWAVFGHPDALEARVGAACQGLVHHLADLSAGRRMWRVEGVLARELIAKGCSLDTDPRVFGPGRCAQTLLAQVAVLLIPRIGPSIPSPSFDIVADASLAGHLRAWFADAALEFQP